MCAVGFRKMSIRSMTFDHIFQAYHTNGHNFGSSSQPTSSEVLNSGAAAERPSSRLSQNVEIVIQGRTRSRTDLCPDVPRSKFEHAV